MPADVHNLAEVERYVKEDTHNSKRNADSDSDQDHSSKRKTSAPPSPSVSPSGDNHAAASLNGAALNAALSSAQNTSGLVLTAEQQQQILQYAQANGQQDLAASLANAMVSPISVPGNLSSTLLQSLQAANVITSLPGPPHLPNMDGSTTGQVSTEEDSAHHRKQANNGRALTDDERRQRRLLRNRMAAKECRKKKKHYVQTMEEKISHLEEENQRLRKEIEAANAKLALGSMQEGSESYRLMKEVEELNAKLGHPGLQFIHGVGQQLGELAQAQATESRSSNTNDTKM
ncbi:X-box-binding protein 1 [Umbelopsis sp. WA50703]